MKKPIKNTVAIAIIVSLLGSVSALLLAQGVEKRNLERQHAMEKQETRAKHALLSAMLQSLPEDAVLSAIANEQSRMHKQVNWDEAVTFADHLIQLGVASGNASTLSPELLAEKLTEGARTFTRQKKQAARRLSTAAQRTMRRISQRRSKMVHKYGENWVIQAEADSITALDSDR